MKFTGNTGAQIIRSDLILPSDRSILEQKVMGKLQAGGGLFGLRMIENENNKKQHLGVEEEKVIVKRTDILKKASIDGVFVNDPDFESKYADSNIQRLEERLLKNGLTEFFHSNGDLKLDNDLLADQMSRPQNFSFLETSQQMCKEVNAVLSDRLHSYKRQYYRLDVIVGKIDMFHCKDFFAPEDIEALKLREQFKEYENRVSLAMIPHYMQRLSFIDRQITEKTRNVSGITAEELSFLKIQRKEVQDKLENEKRDIQALSDQLFATWTRIQKLRDEKGYSSTNVNLKIHRNITQDNTAEYVFNLTHQNPSTKRKDGTALPDTEELRRKNASTLKAYCNLMINGKKVASTRRAALSWPAFECEIGELFQIHVFTMPSSVQLELMLVDGCSACCWSQQAAIIDVEVPGLHVKALTSATSIVQEHNFSMYEYEESVLRKSVKGQSEEDIEKVEKQIQNKRKDLEIGVAKDLDIRGQLYVKAEWRGNGPCMPPIKSENLFKRKKADKNRREYSEKEERQMLLKQLYIDVNDPRNEKIIKILKETKNEFLVKLFKEDTKNQLFNVEPFRHKLLKARLKNPDFGGIFIPMLESEIIDGDRCTFYLEQLEKLYRDEAYLIHLEKRAIESKNQDQKDQADGLDNKLNLVDLDTLRRRQLIFDQIKDAVSKIISDGKGSSSSYKSVVREYELDIETTNPFVAVYRRLFRRERKLKPLVQKKPVTAFENVKQCQIYVHCIQGDNVPIRADYIDTYRRVRGENKNSDSRSMNNRRSGARPTASAARGMSFRNRRNNEFDDDDYEEDDQTQMAAAENEDLNAPMVQTYLEVKVQYRDNYAIVKRTKIYEGQAPKWNEVLTFPLEALNKENFTKEELLLSTTQIICSLYDRQTYGTNVDGKYVQQEENRFLGSISIPLTLIMAHAEKTDFNFKINRPLVLPSYRVLKQDLYLMNPETGDLDENEIRKNEQKPTYLNLSLSLDPGIELPMENSQAYYPGAEDSNLLIAGSEWVKGILNNKKLTQRFKNTNLAVFGQNLEGKSVFLSRFLAPLKPPEDLLDLDRNPNDPYAIEAAARFVSIIPCTTDTKQFHDMPNLYCTAQEFIDMGAGGVEEHAYLLANYFTYIDERQNPGAYKCYVVYGEAMPEGPSAYVMRTKNVPNSSFELWSPLSGECFFFQSSAENQSRGFSLRKNTQYLAIRFHDPICQLAKVFFVVGSDNIWANIQQHDIPVLMNYNFSEKKFWKPFFSSETQRKKFFPLAVSTVHAPVKYSPRLPQNQIAQLESKIQKFIVEEFQDQRIKDVRKTTKWAIAVQDNLRRILVDCEEHMKMARHGASDSNLRGNNANEDQDIQLERVATAMNKLGGSEKQKRVWGFPLNFTFVSLDQVWKEVLGTKIHAINRQDVEFALAVHVESYPANILSVWVYLAAFVDKSFEAGQL